jgi:WD40 repeat protein
MLLSLIVTIIKALPLFTLRGGSLMFRCRLLLAFFAFSLTLVAVAEQPEPAKDANGDPLPVGAIARLGTTRWRHEGLISFAAFLPDGKSVISVAGDMTIRVWEFPSGKELRRIDVPLSNLGPLQKAGAGGRRIDCGAVLTTDGKVIANYFDTGLRGQDTSGPEIRVHDVATGKELFMTRPGGMDVLSMTLSPTGERVICRMGDGTTRIWEWATGKELPWFFSPDSNGRPRGGRIRFPQLEDDHDPVCSADGNTLMFLGRSNALRFVDLPSGREKGPNGHATPLQLVHFSDTGKEIVTHAADGTVKKWETSRGKYIGPIATPAPPSGKLIEDLKELNKKRTVSPDGQIVLTTGPLPTAIKITDAASGREISSLDTPESLFRMPIIFSPGNKLLAVVGRPAPATKKADPGQRIHLFDISTGKYLHTLETVAAAKKIKPKAALQSIAPSLSFSPDSSLLAWGAGDTVYVWNTSTGKRVGLLNSGQGSPVFSTAFSRDGYALAVEMNDGSLTLFELASASARQVFGRGSTPLPKRKQDFKDPFLDELEPQHGSRLAISTDSAMTALAGEQDRTVRVWDVITGKELASFKGHTAPINAVAFSPDSKLLASASADTTALIWDLSKLERTAPAAKKLQPAELEEGWQALALADGNKAFAAICDLTASPAEAIAWIKDKVKPAVTVDMKTIESLIVQLDDNQFKVRDKAAKDLNNIGEQIVPALEKALEGNLTLETKRRIEELRDRLSSRVLQGDRLRNYRAVEVLERIGTPEARQVLQTLADGAPDVLLTTSARAALERVRH